MDDNRISIDETMTTMTTKKNEEDRSGDEGGLTRHVVHVDRYASTRRAARRLVIAVLACGGAGLVLGYTAGSPDVTRVDSGVGGELVMDVTRTPGAEAVASRCSDCPQPGDRIRVSLRGSLRDPRGSARGIRVYRDGDGLASSCDACTSLDLVLSSVGRYEIVGVEAGRGCPIVASADIDRDLLAMVDCGARFVTSRLDVR